MENELKGIKRYKFSIDDIIGKGGFGSVYKSIDLRTNQNVAIKQIHYENNEEKSLIINEINLMKNIDSFYCIKLIDHFIDEKYIYIVMELCDDNLNNYVKNKGKLKIEVIQKILVQLNDVLRIMKTKNISHRNIKPENILIKYINQNDFVIKLSDFGLKKELNSKNYSPEDRNKNYNYKDDLYSIGIVLHYLYFGEYHINEIKNNYDNIEIKNLINNLIEKDVNKRLDWNNYLNHPFIIDYFKRYLNLKLLNDDIYELSEIYISLKTKYIGQLLKGTNIREGKGIDYYENGNKRYEGDYKEGKADGKGIEYYENGNKRYEGDWKDGMPNGKGILYYENGNKSYEGDWKEGKQDGKGIKYYENGKKEYEGY